MLKDSIYKTLAFFDAQDLALTLFEIKNYLDTPARVQEIEDCIEREMGGKVASQAGLYFLSGRDELSAMKKSRYRLSLERAQKAKNRVRRLAIGRREVFYGEKRTIAQSVRINQK